MDAAYRKISIASKKLMSPMPASIYIYIKTIDITVIYGSHKSENLIFVIYLLLEIRGYSSISRSLKGEGGSRPNDHT